MWEAVPRLLISFYDSSLLLRFGWCAWQSSALAFLYNRELTALISHTLLTQQVNFTGKKWQDKLYRWHTGYPGGLKERSAKDMLRCRPDFVLRKAILGMIYRTKLRDNFMAPRLKIYTGPDHPHSAQLGDDVEPLPKVPRSRKCLNGFSFGLGEKYSTAAVEGRNESLHKHKLPPQIPRTRFDM